MATTADCEERWSTGAQAEAEVALERCGGDGLVGLRLQLFVPRTGVWAEGVAEAFIGRSEKHRIRFADGKSVTLTLRADHARWLPLDPIPPPTAGGENGGDAAEAAPVGPEPSAAAALRSKKKQKKKDGKKRAAAASAAAHEDSEASEVFNVDGEVEPADDDDLTAAAEAASASSKAKGKRKAPRASAGVGGNATGKRARASTAGGGDGAAAAEPSGRISRPPGRAPSGMTWDYVAGVWVAKEPAAGAVSGTDGGDGAGSRALVAVSGTLVGTAASAATTEGVVGGSTAVVAVGDDAPTDANAAAPEPAAASSEALASTWEDAGADLPGWTVERRVAATGRHYSIYHGPFGNRATSRAQALAGGGTRRNGGAIKPMEDMSVRELISERSQGIPMSTARALHARRRREGAGGVGGADEAGGGVGRGGAPGGGGSGGGSGGGGGRPIGTRGALASHRATSLRRRSCARSKPLSTSGCTGRRSAATATTATAAVAMVRRTTTMGRRRRRRRARRRAAATVASMRRKSGGTP